MNQSNIAIILSRPEEPRNIGAVCRAMANSDIKDLRIIGKREDIDEEKVKVLAIHAYYIYENARFFSSITEASKDCTLVAGTTRRRGKKRKGKLLLPEEFAKSAGKISDKAKVAVVFGNERTGLEDDELLECSMGVTIPTSDEFGSLNLSHAVQIICYTLFREKNKAKKGYTPVTSKRINDAAESIADSLKKIGFFKITGRKDMELFWRDIMSRAAVSEGEVQYIEKIFDKAAGLYCKNQSSMNVMSSATTSSPSE